MARVEWVTVKSSLESVMKPYFNIDRSVGKGGTNWKNDVMLVQAMLKFPRWLNSIPEVSGTMDTITEHAIVEFVENNPNRKLKVSDPYGLIRPGFVGGKVEKFSERRMLIQELNYIIERRAREVDPDMPKDGPIRFLLYAYPSLQGVLRGITISKYGSVGVKSPAGGAIVDVRYR
jgi:hypothetical protein